MGVIAACVIWCVSGPPVQAKPDFTGRWVLAATASSGPAIARELTVEHSTAKGTLTVTRVTRGGTHTDSYKFGSTGGQIVMGQRGPMTKDLRVMGWDGSVLVISMVTSYNRDQDSGHQEAWSLGADGRLTIVTTAWSPGNDATVSTVMYRRK
jgi:hypothetical protein